MTNLEIWAVLVGALAPLVIAVVQQPKWQPWQRAVVTLVFCAATGTVNAYFNDQFHGKTITSSVLLVLISSLATYEGLWKKTVTPKIEQATSPKTK